MTARGSPTPIAWAHAAMASRAGSEWAGCASARSWWAASSSSPRLPAEAQRCVCRCRSPAEARRPDRPSARPPSAGRILRSSADIALAWRALAASQPSRDLLAGRADRLAGVAKRFTDALGVEGDRLAAVGAGVDDRVVPMWILAADDSVELAGAHPRHQLVRALDRQRMGYAEVEHQPGQPIEAAAFVGVVEPLAHERVEVELIDHRSRGERHEGAADDEGIARDDRGGTIGAQLGRPAPLHQRGADGRERQRQPGGAGEQHEDRERCAVELVVGEDVSRLVREHRAALLGVEQPDELRLDHHARPARADRERVGRGELREVQVWHVGHVERGVSDRVLAPDIAELLLGETHRGAEVALAQSPLVTELDELAYDPVEVGNRAEGGGGGAVGRMLEGPR